MWRELCGCYGPYEKRQFSQKFTKCYHSGPNAIRYVFVTKWLAHGMSKEVFVEDFNSYYLNTIR